MTKKILFLSLSYLLMLSVSYAEAPIPPSKTSSLQKLEQTLDQKKSETETLEKELKALSKDLKKTKELLIQKAREVQNNESNLKKLEDRITTLEEEQKKIEANINEDKKSTGRLLIALKRLRSIPPEAIIASPGAPIETARSAYLIKKIVPTLNHHAEQLRKEVETLQANRKELEEKRADAYERTKKLKNQYAKLDNLTKKREAIYTSIQGDYAASQKKIGQIAKEANNLKDLVKKLDEEKTRARTREASYYAIQRMQQLSTPVISGDGSNQLPVSGILRVRYGDLDKFGANSQGIKIEARSNALVVAPMAGTVRYKGTFKNYGNIVIVEHKKGYHSLVAGLQKIDTVVGQAVAAGEPIGTLPPSHNGKKPQLYYELRYKGSPVDPSRKFGDLG